MSWLDILGWAGSALLIVSVMQTRILRLRLLNLAATLALLVFNWGIGVWSMVAMNFALAVLNIYYIIKLRREHRGAGTAYEVVAVAAQDPSLVHFVARHQSDIAKYNPGFAGVDPDSSAYLLQHGDTTAGVVLVHDAGAGVAQIDLDYVTAPYRDFSPGEFVFRDSGLFQRQGVRRILTRPGMITTHYERLGFTPEGDHWALTLEPAPSGTGATA
ncbi:MAG: hypothetical protein WAT47_09705 [Nostocoides sp.]